MRLCRVVLLLCLVWSVQCVCPGSAAVVKGVANSEDGFAFIGRFCFDNGPEVDGVKPHVGDIAMWVHDPDYSTVTQDTNVQWAAYDDASGHWQAVQDNRQQWSCQQLVDAANIKNSFQWDASGTADTGSSPVEIQQSTRPRFWFLALFACSETAGSSSFRPIRDVEYSVHFTNIMQSSWDREFGTNERGLNTLYLCLFIVYTIFFIVHFIGVHRLRQQLSFVHPIVKLFAVILCVQYVAVVLSFLHYLQYGRDGVGLIWLSYCGLLLDAVARIMFIFLLLLLAHGWTISNDHLQQRWIIAAVLLCFLCLQVAQFGYSWYSFNPELTAVNKGEFVLQCLVVAVYLLLGVYFVFMLCVSWVNEIIPPKKRLYLRLGLLFSPWMIGPPLVAIGVLLLDDWVRTKIVLTLQQSLTLIAYIALSFLLWPSRAQEYFSINTPTLSDFRAAYERL